MKKKEFISGVKQSVWGWPAVFNLSAGGAAAGFYLLSFLLNQRSSDLECQFLDTLFRLTAPVLVGMGFFVVAFETGKPSRAKYLLHNINSSWMSREVFFGLSFLCLTLIDSIFPNSIIKFIAGVMAIGILFSQGFMINWSCGVTAWHTPMMPFYFIFSGLYLGFGLLLIWSVVILPQPSTPMLIVGLIILIFDLTFWIAYLKNSADISFRYATRSLRQPLALINAIAIGHCLPAALLLFLIQATTWGAKFIPISTLSVSIGAIIICSAIYQSFALILMANYFSKISTIELKQNAYHERIFKSR